MIILRAALLLPRLAAAGDATLRDCLSRDTAQRTGRRHGRGGSGITA